MKHCVATYSDACARGSSRIFSITKGGAKTCTLELAPIDVCGDRILKVDFSQSDTRKAVKGWKCVQNRGKHNASINDKELLAFCDSLAISAQTAFAAQTKLIAEAEEAARKEKAASLGLGLQAKLAKTAHATTIAKKPEPKA
jgi:hypothetical protein